MSNDLRDILKSEDVESIILGPSSPAHVEGQIFYDSESKSHGMHMDIPGVTLSVGQEQYIRVINDTGSTITNGQICAHDGADVVSGLPKAQLALADTFASANVLGLATHDILDGEEGLLTTLGKIHDVDTSELLPNVPAYLSDTIPGALTSTPPDIVSRMGGPIIVDASSGVFFVRVDNNTVIPTLFGLLSTINDTYDLTTTYQSLINYQVEDAVTMPVDKLAGAITLLNAGRYRGSFTISLTVPTKASSRTISLQAWNITQGEESASIPISVARDITEVGRSISVPFTVVAGDVIVMRISADEDILGVVIDSISYDIESIHVTV